MLKKIFIILSLSLSFSTASADEAADKAKFKKLYAEFNDLYQNSEAIEPIIEVAEKLYKIAPKAYGKNAQNTAVVIYNLASLYDEKGGKSSSEDEKKAANLYKDYFNILEKKNSPKNQTYLSQYVAFVYAENNANRNKSVTRLSKKAISIAEEIGLPNTTIAGYELKFGLMKYQNDQGFEAKKLFEASLLRYENELGKDHFKVAENLFWLGKISMTRQRRKTSEEQFLRALNIFQQDDSEAAKMLAQSTHAFLVQVYENMGRSGEATKHCRAIAVERNTNFDAYIDPLFRKPPTFPLLRSYEISKVREEDVNVLLEFDVDENGITKNVKILSSDNEKFNKNSIEAAAKFRYAPSVKNGQIVETKGVKTRILYNMN